METARLDGGDPGPIHNSFAQRITKDPCRALEEKGLIATFEDVPLHPRILLFRPANQGASPLEGGFLSSPSRGNSLKHRFLIRFSRGEIKSGRRPWGWDVWGGTLFIDSKGGWARTGCQPCRLVGRLRATSSGKGSPTVPIPSPSFNPLCPLPQPPSSNTQRHPSPPPHAPHPPSPLRHPDRWWPRPDRRTVCNTLRRLPWTRRKGISEPNGLDVRWIRSGSTTVHCRRNR